MCKYIPEESIALPKSEGHLEPLSPFSSGDGGVGAGATSEIL